MEGTLADPEKEAWGIRIELLHLASPAAELGVFNDLLILSNLRPSTLPTPGKPSKSWRL